jgi:hypothetical protein
MSASALNSRSRLARFCTTPNLTLSRPAFYHRAVTMSPSPTTDQGPAPFLDDQDESVRIAVKALGDMRNSRPQPSGSNSTRVYNLSSPSNLVVSTTAYHVYKSPGLRRSSSRHHLHLPISPARLRRRCEFSRFRRPRINNTSRKHRLASLRTNESKLKGRQSTIPFLHLLPTTSILHSPTSIRV